MEILVVFQTMGIVLATTFIVLAVVHRDVTRMTTWYLVMASLAFFCISRLVLINIANREPNFGFCFFQLLLLSSASFLMPLAGVIFKVQMYAKLRLVQTNGTAKISAKLAGRWFLIGLTSALVGLVMLLIIIIGFVKRDHILSDNRCTLRSSLPTQIVGVLVIVCSLAAYCLLAAIFRVIFLLRRRPAGSQKKNNSLITKGNLAQVMIININATAALIVGILHAVNVETPQVVTIIFALLAILGFGMSTVVLGVKRKTSSSSTIQSSQKSQSIA